MAKLMMWVRAGGIVLLLVFGVATAQPVTAQDAATEVATEAAETVDQADEAIDDEDDGGFDDWGLLGLLGLAGLAGLYRRPRSAVRNVDRSGFTSAGDRIDDRGL